MQLFLNILTILAFIMSAITWIVTALRHSIFLTVELKDYAKWFNNVVQLFLYIQNNSASPITVSGISILYDGKKFPCELVPKKLRTEDGIVTRSTPMFPLNFAGLQGTMYFFEFVNCPDIELAQGKTIDFEIYTNRGRLKKSVTLGPQDRYFRLH